MYLANCGNPIEYDSVKQEIENMMKLKFDEGTIWGFDKCFSDTDTKGVSAQDSSCIQITASLSAAKILFS